MTRNTFISALALSITITGCTPEVSIITVPPQQGPNYDVTIIIENAEEQESAGVLEGWMSYNSIQTIEPGESFIVEWAFRYTALAGDPGSSVSIAPTGFNFHVDSNGDGLFGTQEDETVAGEVVHWCSLPGRSDIGGPAQNSMGGGMYGTYTVTDGAPLTFVLLECQTFSDAPRGTDIAVSMTYATIQSTDVYDATVARTANAGFVPQSYVEISLGECDPYEVRVDNGQTEFTESKPVVAFDTTWMIYPNSWSSFFIGGDLYTAGGCGEGVTVNDITILIENISTETLLTPATATLQFEDFEVQLDCTSAYYSYFNTQEYRCSIFDLADNPATTLQVLPDTNGEPFELRVQNLPDFGDTADTPMLMSMYIHWTDIATNNGYTRNSWLVVDGDQMQVATYVPTP